MKSSQEMIDFLLSVGWTKIEIADAIGVTSVTILHWHRGGGKPRFEIFKKLWKLYQQVKKEFQIEGED